MLIRSRRFFSALEQLAAYAGQGQLAQYRRVLADSFAQPTSNELPALLWASSAVRDTNTMKALSERTSEAIAQASPADAAHMVHYYQSCGLLTEIKKNLPSLLKDSENYQDPEVARLLLNAWTEFAELYGSLRAPKPYASYLASVPIDEAAAFLLAVVSQNEFHQLPSSFKSAMRQALIDSELPLKPFINGIGFFSSEILPAESLIRITETPLSELSAEEIAVCCSAILRSTEVEMEKFANSLFNEMLNGRLGEFEHLARNTLRSPDPGSTSFFSIVFLFASASLSKAVVPIDEILRDSAEEPTSSKSRARLTYGRLETTKPPMLEIDQAAALAELLFSCKAYDASLADLISISVSNMLDEKSVSEISPRHLNHLGYCCYVLRWLCHSDQQLVEKTRKWLAQQLEGEMPALFELEEDPIGVVGSQPFAAIVWSAFAGKHLLECPSNFKTRGLLNWVFNQEEGASHEAPAETEVSAQEILSIVDPAGNDSPIFQDLKWFLSQSNSRGSWEGEAEVAVPRTEGKQETWMGRMQRCPNDSN